MTTIPVDEFFEFPGYRPLYETVFYKTRSMLIGTAVFPMIFYFFPTAEGAPLFCTASLVKWDWRRLPSYFVSMLAQTSMSYFFFSQFMTKLAPKRLLEETTHTLPQLWTFLSQIENQWAAKLFSLTANFVPLKSTDTMKLTRVPGVTIEHILLEDLAGTVASRFINAGRFVCRQLIWPHIFTEHERRHEGRPKQFVKGWIKRCFVDGLTPVLAYFTMKHAVPKIPYVNAIAPLVTYRFARAACMGITSKLWDYLSPLVFPKPKPLSDEENFQQASDYISEVGVVPAEFESTKGFALNLLQNQGVPAGMKLAMCETLWAMETLEKGYEQGFVDHSVLKWYAGEIHQYRKGEDDEHDEDIVSSGTAEEDGDKPISPLKREMTELVAPESSSLFQTDDGNSQQCSICLNVLEPGQRCAKIKSCGHKFHALCLVGWVMRNPNCPMCRKEFTSSSKKKKNPPAYFFPVWLKKFDIPRSYDNCEWDEICTFAKVRELPVNPGVFKMLEGDFINCRIGLWDFLIGIPLWTLDLYPPDDIINFEVCSRDPQLWRLGISTNDCPIYPTAPYVGSYSPSANAAANAEEDGGNDVE